MLRNDCADNPGITVRITPESLCGLERILHLSAVTAVGKGTEQGETPIAKVIGSISVLINRLYKFKGIYHFKDKFHPYWEPHYLAYPGTTALIPALLTMLRLYSERKSV